MARKIVRSPFPASLATVLVLPTPDLPINKTLNEKIAGVTPDGRLGCSSNPEKRPSIMWIY